MSFLITTPLSFALELSCTLGKVGWICLRSTVRFVLPCTTSWKSLKNEKVLITGGAGGIGRLQAIRYVKAGAIVVLWDINAKALEDVASELKAMGGTVFTYVCDISARENVYRVAEQVKQEVGDIDILVNNAGIVTGRKFMDCPDALIEKTFQVNSMSMFWTTKAFLPKMMEKNHGHIVTIASAAGTTGTTGLADYCASKFAAVGFDESMRFEFQALGLDGVHTTCICPYYINTGMFDGVKTRFGLVLPILEPEWAADRIMRAVRTNEQFVMMPRFTYITYLMRFLLPTAALDTIGHFFGVTKSMDEFKGRN